MDLIKTLTESVIAAFDRNERPTAQEIETLLREKMGAYYGWNESAGVCAGEGSRGR